jgi:hypothetical protein
MINLVGAVVALSGFLWYRSTPYLILSATQLMLFRSPITGPGIAVWHEVQSVRRVGRNGLHLYLAGDERLKIYLGFVNPSERGRVVEIIRERVAAAPGVGAGAGD